MPFFFFELVLDGWLCISSIKYRIIYVCARILLVILGHVFLLWPYQTFESCTNSITGTTDSGLMLVFQRNDLALVHVMLQTDSHSLVI